MTPKHEFGSCSELGLKVCQRNRRWKQTTAALFFLGVRLIYDHILLCELERGVKEPAWFPHGVLTVLVMLKFLLVFHGGVCGFGSQMGPALEKYLPSF